MRLWILLLALILISACAYAEDALHFETVPSILRPGKVYDFAIYATQETAMTATLADTNGTDVYTIYADYPLAEGESQLHWDGLRADTLEPVAEGEYTLRFTWNNGRAEFGLRIGSPYPLLSHLAQVSPVLPDTPGQIAYTASMAGTVTAVLRDPVSGTLQPVVSAPALAGENILQWNGMLGSDVVADGQHTLLLTLRTDTGAESITHALQVDVGETAAEAAPADGDGVFIADGTPEAGEADPTADTGEAAATDAPPEDDAATTPAPSPNTSAALSPPYSAVNDGSFWSMTPGELDDAAIWAIMMQPITVYDGGLDQKEHAYLMENPDGTGARVAQIHALAQGLHILGEPNEHGYVLAEAFSSYDDKYKPSTKAEKAAAFELKQGYIKAGGLKEVQVQQDMALLLDKLTQRMYLFKNGERVTEFVISTGIVEDEKYYQETTAGEFITVSHTGTLVTSKYMHCDMAIRINGGILIHEVPHEPLRDGSKRYAQYEEVLGQKASHGCIRVQRKLTPEGYNHEWLWDNLKPSAPYKVLIWDDLGRVDTPAVWQATN